MRQRASARWMLRLLPRELREEYGDDFVELLQHRVDTETKTGGWRSALRYRLRALVDVLQTAWRGVSAPGFKGPDPHRQRFSSRFDAAAQDLRYGARQLRRNPGFTFVAVLTLAVGIGGNTAVFNLTNTALLRSLPVDNAENLLFVFTHRPNSRPPRRPYGNLTYAGFEEIQRHNSVFEDLAAGGGGLNVTIGEGANTERVQAQWVSGDYFTVLGVRPRLGRALTAADVAVSNEPTVLISSRLWQTRFGEDPAVLGTMMLINEQPFTIVGVVPAEFNGLAPSARIDVWFAARWWRHVYRDIYGENFDWTQGIAFYTFGHLRDGVSREAAAAQILNVVASGVLPGWSEEHGIFLSSASVDPSTRQQWTRYALWATVTSCMLLLVAWVNTAGLMMARTLARDQEISIRVALGCNRGRLLRQLLTEGLLLATLAGIASLATANSLARLVLSVAPLPEFTPTVDANVAFFTLAIVAASALALSLLPAARAWPARRRHPGGNAAPTDSHSARTQSALIVAQVAVTVCLLVVAGLFLRTYRNVANTELGFETDRVTTLALNPATQGYDALRTTVLRGQLVERLRALPGVTIVTPGTSPDFSGWAVPATTKGASQREGEVRITTAGPGWFEALGIPIVQGRAFTDADESRAFEIAIVAEETARRFWPDENPLGKQLMVSAFRNAGLASDRTVQVIGVAADTRAVDGLNYSSSLRLTLKAGAAIAPRVYIPDSSADGYATRINLIVRSREPAEPLIPAISTEVRQLDSSLAMRVETLAEVMRLSMRAERTYAGFTSAFSVTATVLAVIGIFAMMAHAVSRRRRTFGIHMALGASASDIAKIVILSGLTPVLIGTAIGVALTVLLSRFLESLLYGVEPVDPITYAATTVLVIAAAAAAGVIPAIRAIRVDPCTTLRVE